MTGFLHVLLDGLFHGELQFFVALFSRFPAFRRNHFENAGISDLADAFFEISREICKFSLCRPENGALWKINILFIRYFLRNLVHNFSVISLNFFVRNNAIFRFFKLLFVNSALLGHRFFPLSLYYIFSHFANMATLKNFSGHLLYP